MGTTGLSGRRVRGVQLALALVADVAPAQGAKVSALALASGDLRSFRWPAGSTSMSSTVAPLESAWLGVAVPPASDVLSVHALCLSPDSTRVVRVSELDGAPGTRRLLGVPADGNAVPVELQRTVRRRWRRSVR